MRPEHIARNLQHHIHEVQRNPHHIGIATDGDGNRIWAVDPSGRFIDPHCIMALYVEYSVQERRIGGSIVKSFITSQMLNRPAIRHNLPLHKTFIVFNLSSNLMRRVQVLVGSEYRGGIRALGHIPEGDGVLMALLLVEIVAADRRSLTKQVDALMAAHDAGPFGHARLGHPVRLFSKPEIVERLVSTARAQSAGTPIVEANCRVGVKYLLQDDS